MPQIEDLDRYSEIRLVEVIGVKLTAYEAYELMRRGVRPLRNPQALLGDLYPTSSTAAFEVQALVDRTIKGPAAHTAQITLGGCAVVPPQLRQRGLVFLESGTGHAFAVWQSEGESYRKLASALGLEATDSR